MSDTPPAAPTKSFLLSKTFWLQIIMMALAFFPPALAWVKSNPVETLAVIAALNVLVRFATRGRVSLFPPEEVEKKPGGASGGVLSFAIGWIGLAAVASMGALPSCSSMGGEYPVAITLRLGK